MDLVPNPSPLLFGAFGYSGPPRSPSLTCPVVRNIIAAQENQTRKGGRELELWFSERQTPSVALSFKIARTVHREQTKYQDLAVLETTDDRRVLVLDGCIMTTDLDEFVYHEMIAHVPMCTHPNPRTVLVVGGGDGGTIREVLKHGSVQTAVLAEIDEGVIEASRRHLPHLSASLADPRCRIMVGDGAEHVRSHRGEYDVIICDSTDPVGPGTVLFSEEFYGDCHRSLTVDGVFCAQMESPFVHAEVIGRSVESLRRVFPVVRLYLAVVPSYPGALWSFVLASKKHDPIRDARAVSLETRYYSPEVHKAAFVLPRFVEELVRPRDSRDGQGGEGGNVGRYVGSDAGSASP
jgi:spermidine synthase